MSINYTAVVNVTGEGGNGGRVQSDDGVLQTTLAYPKELGGAGDAPRATRASISVTINATAV